MPILIAPSITSVPGPANKVGRYVVRSGYDFEGELPSLQNLGGISFDGFVWTLDVSQIKTPIQFSTPAFRTLQFTCSFPAGEEDENGPGGQVMRFGAPVPQPSTTTDPTIQTVSGCVGIVTNSPTVIQFGKELDGGTLGTTTGKLIVSLFDFELPAWIAGGQSQSY